MHAQQYNYCKTRIQTYIILIQDAYGNRHITVNALLHYIRRFYYTLCLIVNESMSANMNQFKFACACVNVCVRASVRMCMCVCARVRNYVVAWLSHFVHACSVPHSSFHSVV